VFEYDTECSAGPPASAAPDAATPPPLAIPLRASVQLSRNTAPAAQIVVYTDSIGMSVQIKACRMRVPRVYQVLTAAGIAPDRLQWHALVPHHAGGNQTPQGRIENRRVEIEFRPEPAAAP